MIKASRAHDAARKEIERINKEIEVQEKELQALKMKEVDLLKDFNRIEELRNYNYENYDITGVENNFILKQDAVRRVVKEISVYENPLNFVCNFHTIINMLNPPFYRRKVNNSNHKDKTKESIHRQTNARLVRKNNTNNRQEIKISYACYLGNILGCLSVETSFIFGLQFCQ